MSQRSDRARANRRPYWLGRASRALECGTEGVAVQYDLARTQIRRIALLGERDREWAALAVTITGFNTRFTGGEADASGAGRRLVEAERRFKTLTSQVERAAAAYDLARTYLRRIADGERQEQQWRELEDALRQFNKRFSRDRTRAVPA